MHRRHSNRPDTRFTHSSTVDGKTAIVRFTLSAKADCRLRFDFDVLDQSSFNLVSKTMGRPGMRSCHFALDAQSRSGNRVSSDTLSLISFRHKDGGFTIEVDYLAATVRLVMDGFARNPILKLWFRGFSSYRNTPVETPLGTLEIWGATKPSSVDEMTGFVAIKSQKDTADSAWCSKADEFLSHMHRGMALAYGGRLQTPRLDHVEGNIFTATFFAGSGHQPEFPIQHSLNQGPIISALTNRYFERGPLPEVLWTALGWMQVDTTFDEVRFLTAMTAIETIIESELPARRGTVLPKTKFKTLRRRLEEVIALYPDATCTQRDVFATRVAGINKKTFAEKIDAVFDHYRISRRDFSTEVILSLVRLRNEIVHRGLLPDNTDIWESIILVRELITRIFLSEIGFEGRYCCYIGGRHDRDFPELPMLQDKAPL